MVQLRAEACCSAKEKREGTHALCLKQFIISLPFPIIMKFRLAYPQIRSLLLVTLVCLGALCMMDAVTADVSSLVRSLETGRAMLNSLSSCLQTF